MDKAESDGLAGLLNDRDSSATLDDANELFLSSHRHRLLLRFDAKFASRLLARNPLKFFELAKAVMRALPDKVQRRCQAHFSTFFVL